MSHKFTKSQQELSIETFLGYVQSLNVNSGLKVGDLDADSLIQYLNSIITTALSNHQQQLQQLQQLQRLQPNSPGGRNHNHPPPNPPKVNIMNLTFSPKTLAIITLLFKQWVMFQSDNEAELDHLRSLKQLTPQQRHNLVLSNVMINFKFIESLIINYQPPLPQPPQQQTVHSPHIKVSTHSPDPNAAFDVTGARHKQKQLHLFPFTLQPFPALNSLTLGTPVDLDLIFTFIARYDPNISPETYESLGTVLHHLKTVNPPIIIPPIQNFSLVLPRLQSLNLANICIPRYNDALWYLLLQCLVPLTKSQLPALTAPDSSSGTNTNGNNDDDSHDDNPHDGVGAGDDDDDYQTNDEYESTITVNGHLVYQLMQEFSAIYYRSHYHHRHLNQSLLMLLQPYQDNMSLSVSGMGYNSGSQQQQQQQQQSPLKYLVANTYVDLSLSQRQYSPILITNTNPSQDFDGYGDDANGDNGGMDGGGEPTSLLQLPNPIPISTIHHPFSHRRITQAGITHSKEKYFLTRPIPTALQDCIEQCHQTPFSWRALNSLNLFSASNCPRIGPALALTPKLERLSLSHTKLSDIRGLCAVSHSLAHIDLSFNAGSLYFSPSHSCLNHSHSFTAAYQPNMSKIDTITTLIHECSNIQVLNLAGNALNDSHIASLAQLRCFPLVTLDLSFNNLQNIVSLWPLRALNNLRSIYFRNTPLAKTSNYRTNVAAMFVDNWALGDLYANALATNTLFSLQQPAHPSHPAHSLSLTNHTPAVAPVATMSTPVANTLNASSAGTTPSTGNNNITAHNTSSTRLTNPTNPANHTKGQLDFIDPESLSQSSPQPLLSPIPLCPQYVTLPPTTTTIHTYRQPVLSPLGQVWGLSSQSALSSFCLSPSSLLICNTPPNSSVHQPPLSSPPSNSSPLATPQQSTNRNNQSQLQSQSSPRNIPAFPTSTSLSSPGFGSVIKTPFYIDGVPLSEVEAAAALRAARMINSQLSSIPLFSLATRGANNNPPSHSNSHLTHISNAITQSVLPPHLSWSLLQQIHTEESNKKQFDTNRHQNRFANNPLSSTIVPPQTDNTSLMSSNPSSPPINHQPEQMIKSALSNDQALIKLYHNHSHLFLSQTHSSGTNGCLLSVLSSPCYLSSFQYNIIKNALYINDTMDYSASTDAHFNSSTTPASKKSTKKTKRATALLGNDDDGDYGNDGDSETRSISSSISTTTSLKTPKKKLVAGGPTMYTNTNPPTLDQRVDTNKSKTSQATSQLKETMQEFLGSSAPAAEKNLSRALDVFENDDLLILPSAGQKKKLKGKKAKGGSKLDRNPSETNLISTRDCNPGSEPSDMMSYKTEMTEPQQNSIDNSNRHSITTDHISNFDPHALNDEDGDDEDEGERFLDLPYPEQILHDEDQQRFELGLFHADSTHHIDQDQLYPSPIVQDLSTPVPPLNNNSGSAESTLPISSCENDVDHSFVLDPPLPASQIPLPTTPNQLKSDINTDIEVGPAPSPDRADSNLDNEQRVVDFLNICYKSFLRLFDLDVQVFTRSIRQSTSQTSRRCRLVKRAVENIQMTLGQHLKNAEKVFQDEKHISNTDHLQSSTAGSKLAKHVLIYDKAKDSIKTRHPNHKSKSVKHLKFFSNYTLFLLYLAQLPSSIQDTLHLSRTAPLTSIGNLIYSHKTLHVDPEEAYLNQIINTSKLSGVNILRNFRTICWSAPRQFNKATLIMGDDTANGPDQDEIHDAISTSSISLDQINARPESAQFIDRLLDTNLALTEDQLNSSVLPSGEDIDPHFLFSPSYQDNLSPRSGLNDDSTLTILGDMENESCLLYANAHKDLKRLSRIPLPFTATIHFSDSFEDISSQHESQSQDPFFAIKGGQQSPSFIKSPSLTVANRSDSHSISCSPSLSQTIQYFSVPYRYQGAENLPSGDISSDNYDLSLLTPIPTLLSEVIEDQTTNDRLTHLDLTKNIVVEYFTTPQTPLEHDTFVGLSTFHLFSFFSPSFVNMTKHLFLNPPSATIPNSSQTTFTQLNTILTTSPIANHVLSLYRETYYQSLNQLILHYYKDFLKNDSGFITDLLFKTTTSGPLPSDKAPSIFAPQFLTQARQVLQHLFLSDHKLADLDESFSNPELFYFKAHTPHIPIGFPSQRFTRLILHNFFVSFLQNIRDYSNTLPSTSTTKVLPLSQTDHLFFQFEPGSAQRHCVDTNPVLPTPAILFLLSQTHQLPTSASCARPVASIPQLTRQASVELRATDHFSPQPIHSSNIRIITSHQSAVSSTPPSLHQSLSYHGTPGLDHQHHDSNNDDGCRDTDCNDNHSACGKHRDTCDELDIRQSKLKLINQNALTLQHTFDTLNDITPDNPCGTGLITNTLTSQPYLEPDDYSILRNTCPHFTFPVHSNNSYPINSKTPSQFTLFDPLPELQRLYKDNELVFAVAVRIAVDPTCREEDRTKHKLNLHFNNSTFTTQEYTYEPDPTPPQPTLSSKHTGSHPTQLATTNNNSLDSTRHKFSLPTSPTLEMNNSTTTPLLQRTSSRPITTHPNQQDQQYWSTQTTPALPDSSFPGHSSARSIHLPHYANSHHDERSVKTAHVKSSTNPDNSSLRTTSSNYTGWSGHHDCSYPPGLDHDWMSRRLNKLENDRGLHITLSTSRVALTFPLLPSFMSFSQAIQPHSYIRFYDAFPLPMAYVQQPQSTLQQFKVKSRLRGSMSTALHSTPSTSTMGAIGGSSGSPLQSSSVNQIQSNYSNSFFNGFLPPPKPFEYLSKSYLELFYTYQQYQTRLSSLLYQSQLLKQTSDNTGATGNNDTTKNEMITITTPHGDPIDISLDEWLAMQIGTVLKQISGLFSGQATRYIASTFLSAFMQPPLTCYPLLTRFPTVKLMLNHHVHRQQQQQQQLQQQSVNIHYRGGGNPGSFAMESTIPQSIKLSSKVGLFYSPPGTGQQHRTNDNSQFGSTPSGIIQQSYKQQHDIVNSKSADNFVPPLSTVNQQQDEQQHTHASDDSIPFKVPFYNVIWSPIHLGASGLITATPSSISLYLRHAVLPTPSQQPAQMPETNHHSQSHLPNQFQSGPGSNKSVYLERLELIASHSWNDLVSIHTGLHSLDITLLFASKSGHYNPNSEEGLHLIHQRKAQDASSPQIKNTNPLSAKEADIAAVRNGQSLVKPAVLNAYRLTTLSKQSTMILINAIAQYSTYFRTITAVTQVPRLNATKPPNFVAASIGGGQNARNMPQHQQHQQQHHPTRDLILTRKRLDVIVDTETSAQLTDDIINAILIYTTRHSDLLKLNNNPYLQLQQMSDHPHPSPLGKPNSSKLSAHTRQSTHRSASDLSDILANYRQDQPPQIPPQFSVSLPWNQNNSRLSHISKALCSISLATIECNMVGGSNVRVFEPLIPFVFTPYSSNQDHTSLLMAGHNNHRDMMAMMQQPGSNRLNINPLQRGLEPSTEYTDFLTLATNHIIQQQQQQLTQNPQTKQLKYPNSGTPSFTLSTTSPLTHSAAHSTPSIIIPSTNSGSSISLAISQPNQPQQQQHPQNSLQIQSHPTTNAIPLSVLYCCLVNAHIFLLEDTLSGVLQYSNLPFQYQQHALEYSLSLYQHDCLAKIPSSTIDLLHDPHDLTEIIPLLPKLSIPSHLFESAHQDLHMLSTDLASTLPLQQRYLQRQHKQPHQFRTNLPYQSVPPSTGGDGLILNRYRVIACEPLTALLATQAHPIIVSTNTSNIAQLQSIQKQPIQNDFSSGPLIQSSSSLSQPFDQQNNGQQHAVSVPNASFLSQQLQQQKQHQHQRGSRGPNNVSDDLGMNASSTLGQSQSQYQQQPQYFNSNTNNQQDILQNPLQFSISPFDTIATQPITNPSITKPSQPLSTTQSSTSTLSGNNSTQLSGSNSVNHQSEIEFVNLTLTFGTKEMFNNITHNARLWSFVAPRDVLKHLLKHIGQQSGGR